MPISSVMPPLCRRLQADGKVGCFESQPVLSSDAPGFSSKFFFTCQFPTAYGRPRTDVFMVLDILEIA